MAQITLYLDDTTAAFVNQAAQASGMSTSRWVTELIRRNAHDVWPVECLELAGAFTDFPLCEETSEAQSPNAARLGF